MHTGEFLWFPHNRGLCLCYVVWPWLKALTCQKDAWTCQKDARTCHLSFCAPGSLLVQYIQNCSLPMHTVLANTQNNPEESEKCTFSSILTMQCCIWHLIPQMEFYVGAGVVSHGREGWERDHEVCLKEMFLFLALKCHLELLWNFFTFDMI